MYNDATAEMSGLYLSPIDTTDYIINQLYSTDNLARFSTYSDLSYEQIECSLGGTYNFTRNLYLTAQAGFSQFVDDAPYVYGDQDGISYSGSLGLGYRF
ncbi:hypothetical protein JZM60_15630 [Geobacter benzoatilyticus]|uniref:Uncharacterized protein n=1 Tax=Geobacter benzoatilyticus TaxID=2815309 RepID=A0ABX7Q9D1_9BACT|nr:hypothetical protein JZM60_15630 [Geobacter benzoatilyticus]